MTDRRSSLADFELLTRLGSGSFGVVYKSRRLIDNCIYVVKAVRISELSFKEQGEAINEVKLLAQMNSIHVVRYYDSFIEDDSLHIVMEYCNRGDLQNLLKKAKDKSMAGLKESVTWNIFLQILLGLQYLHSKKILHRDLKSANVFLTKDDSQPYFLVKIGDLGVAKLLETSTAFAQTIVGTPYYLSPELCADQPYRDKSDCWALGVLLYECCTLRHPFEARNQCALIMKIVQARYATPSSSSAELISVISWLLQKDPADRPTIKEILNEEYIQYMMEENSLSIPFAPEIPATNRLGCSVPNRITSHAREDQRHINNEAEVIPKSKQKSTSRSQRQSGSTSSRPSSTSITASQTTASVNGNRIRRGAGHSRRVTSERAMLRDQVRIPRASSSTELDDKLAVDGLHKIIEEEGSLRALGGDESAAEKPVVDEFKQSIRRQSLKADNIEGINRNDSLENSVTLSLGGVGFSDSTTMDWADDKYPDVNRRSMDATLISSRLDPTKFNNVANSHADLKETKPLEFISDAPMDAVHSEQIYEDDYDEYEYEQFKEYEEENENEYQVCDLQRQYSSSSVDERTQQKIFQDKNNVYNSPRFKEEIVDEINPLDVMRNIEDLKEMVDDARIKASSMISGDLFRDLYDICRRHMIYEETMHDQQSSMLDKDKIAQANQVFAEELNVIYERMQSDQIGDICDVVFSVKVLLALESRLDQLISDMETSNIRK